MMLLFCKYQQQVVLYLYDWRLAHPPPTIGDHRTNTTEIKIELRPLALAHWPAQICRRANRRRAYGDIILIS